jgi:hypothetical protein
MIRRYSCYSEGDKKEVLKHWGIMRCGEGLVIVLNQLVSHLKKALFRLLQGLQLLNCSKCEILNLLNLYITNAIALISVYSNYLPAPLKVAWLILSCYYRRAFVNDSSRKKNQAAIP